jgi:hypothetical protein
MNQSGANQFLYFDEPEETKDFIVTRAVGMVGVSDQFVARCSGTHKFSSSDRT